LNVTGNATFSNVITVTGNATFSNVITVSGIATLGSSNVSGLSNLASANIGALVVTTSASIQSSITVANTTNLQGNVTVSNDYVIVVTSNTNVGANTTGAQTIFSFPKTSYSSAKITAQVKTVDNSNTQIQEIVLAHDNSGNAFLTVYGTISAPISANLGVFTTSINNANVELYFQQNTANSRIKVIAHLIV